MGKIVLILGFLLFSINLIFAQITNRDSLKQKVERETEDKAIVDLLFELMMSYGFTNQDTVILYGMKGLELARKSGYRIGEAKCLWILTFHFTQGGNYTKALQCGFEHLAIAESLRDTGMLIDANLAQGICYREQEDYDEALKYLYRAEILTRLRKTDPAARGNVLGHISSTYERIDHLDSALHYGLNAYELVKSWSGLYLVLGKTYTRLNRPDTALYYYRAGIPLSEKNLFYNDLVDIYYEMSRLFEKTGSRDSSVYYANTSITQEGVLDYSEGRLRAATQLAKLYESIGRQDSVVKYLKLALELREKIFDREKTREAQSLAFNEKIHQQELATQREQDQNKIMWAILLTAVPVFLIIAFIQWRNNKQKQLAKVKIEKAYEDLKSTQSQLIHSEKMASLGELTAGIAHEIQNPLNFVNNFSEVNKELLEEMQQSLENKDLNEIKALSQNVIENEEKIILHGKRADAIVKSMLLHSRTSTGKKEPTDLNTLIDEYLRLAYHGLRAKDKTFSAEFQTNLDKDLPKVEVIAQDIGRVLLNLINNAFYAATERSKQLATGSPQSTVLSPQSSTGVLQAASSQKPIANSVPTVTVTTKTLGDKIEIRVKDNGNGIPEHIKDKIFQPFFTTKPTGQGTGLGLSLSYDIVKAHGGEIKVESQEGKGTEFIIVLPLTNKNEN